jgi:hypothetical protein
LKKGKVVSAYTCGAQFEGLIALHIYGTEGRTVGSKATFVVVN